MARRILLSPPTVGDLEREFLMHAFDSGWVAPLGPDVDGFEQDLQDGTGAAHAGALSSGTAALHLALILLDVQPGQDVLVQSLTFAATANAVRYTGARPIMVDSCPNTWTLAVDLVDEQLSTPARTGALPAAVIAVDIYRQCADYDRLARVCQRYEVPVISDAAEALGASYRGRPAGSLTDLGVLSFNGNKMITTSGGGALLTSKPDWAARARYLATQAKLPASHYEHAEIGFNYRLSNLLAALGRAQLSRLDDFVGKRRAVRQRYAQALADVDGVTLMPEAEYGRSNAWLTVLQIDPAIARASAEQLRLALAAADIEARPVWKPMHLQPVHAASPVLGGRVSARIFEQGLRLPSAPTLGWDDGRVLDVLRRQLCIS